MRRLGTSAITLLLYLILVSCDQERTSIKLDTSTVDSEDIPSDTNSAKPPLSDLVLVVAASSNEEIYLQFGSDNSERTFSPGVHTLDLNYEVGNQVDLRLPASNKPTCNLSSSPCKKLRTSGHANQRWIWHNPAATFLSHHGQNPVDA